MYFATLVGVLLALLACGYALFFGGRPERLAGALIFADWVATPLLSSHDALHHTQFEIFAMDSALTLILLIMAITSNRFWPLWAAAFQLLEVLIHVAMLIDHGVQPRAYFIGVEIMSYLMLIALATGTCLESPNWPPRWRKAFHS